MNDVSSIVKTLVSHIASAIATYPDDVDVSVKEDEASVAVTITANAEDIGRMIGKDGKTINAIRALVKVPVTKSRKKLMLSISG